MKNLLTTFILALCCVSLQAQPPSVAGVQFGSTYERAKIILDNRFYNGINSYQSEENVITYYDVKFAGEKFDIVSFYFEADTKRSYLSGIIFSKYFKRSESKEATNMRDRLLKIYRIKYDFRWQDSDENNEYKRYVLGHNYFNYENGYIVITTTKRIEKKGILTSVLYMCNGFVKVNIEDEI